MPDEDEGFEPEDTAPPGEWLEDLAAASLSAMRAKFDGEPVTIRSGVTRWTTGRTGLIDALRQTRQHQHMHPEALGALAEEILAHLPEAAPDAEVARLKVCITHLNAKIAEKDGQIAMLTKGDT